MIHTIQAGEEERPAESAARMVRFHCVFGGVPMLLLLFAPVARWAMILS